MPRPARAALRGLALAAALAMPMAAVHADARAETPARTLSLTATGSVEALPDIVRLEMSVGAEAVTAQAALADAAARLTAVFAALDAAGIAAEDRQTRSLSLTPIHDRDERGRPLRLRGYAVSQGFGVVLRDLDGLGALLDALAGAGLDQFGSFAFDVAARDALVDEARRRAVAEAGRTAALLAEAAGQALGAPLSITLLDTAAPRPLAMRAAMAEDAMMPLAEGRLAVTATVSVSYALE